MAYITSKQDATFASGIDGGGAGFESQVIEAANELNDAFPSRFNSIIANGDEHTFLISQFDYAVANTTIKDWVAQMLQEEDWQTVIE